MSTKYKNSSDVPTAVLVTRLYELATAITNGTKAMNREFDMRIPAELDRDADLVLAEAASRLQKRDTQLWSKLEGARHFLFRGWPGCSNHDCIVTGPKSGMGTNGSCTCLQNASRSQLTILAGRLAAFLNDVEQSSKEYEAAKRLEQTEAQMAEPIGWVHSKHLQELEGGHPIRVYPQNTPVVFDSKVPVYTQPQPQAAMPAELLERIKNLLAAVGHHGASLTAGEPPYEIGIAEIKEAQVLFELVKAAYIRKEIPNG